MFLYVGLFLLEVETGCFDKTIISITLRGGGGGDIFRKGEGSGRVTEE